MLFRAYIDRVYSQFRGSEKVLTDNGTEFKNKLINEVCEQLGVKHKIYSPPYRPQSNGKDRILPLFSQSLYFKTYNTTNRMG